MRLSKMQQLKTFELRSRTCPEAVDEKAVSEAVAAAHSVARRTRLRVPLTFFWFIGLSAAGFAVPWDLLDISGTAVFPSIVTLMSPVLVYFMYAEWAHERAREVLELTTALSETTVNQCQRTAHLIAHSAACAALRDVVITRGEVLRVFHLLAMEQLDRATAREQLCRSIHRIPESA